MTRARSVAASVVALGLAGAVIGPSPAFAVSPFDAFVPSAAPPPCERPKHYAAQSSAEFLRIDRLDLLSAGKPANRQATSSGTGEGVSSGTGAPGSSGTGAPGLAGGKPDSAVGGVGLGDVRTVVIADGPVNSAGAARTLNGKVTGSKERGDIAIQKAPPVNPKADTRRTGSKKFGPMQVGAGSLSARAVWAHGMACGKAVGDTSSASAGISRVTIAGGGNASLVRIPEKITSRSGTALRLRGGVQQSVGSATITAGRISLADNEVRLRLLRAPELRVSMTATGQSRVEYQPPVVEVTGKDGKKTRLSTAGDHIEITLSDDTRTLESLPTRLDPIGDPPLPKVSGLPALGRTETTPTPDGKSGSTLRIALGDVRQASKNNAVAARVTAIRVTLTRNVDGGSGQVAAGPSSVVADLGVGSLSAAAVAPTGKITGRYSSQNKTAKANASSQRSGTTSGRGINSGWGDASGQGPKSGAGTTSAQGTPSGDGTASAQGAPSGDGTASGTGTASGQGTPSGDGSASGGNGVSGISGHDDTLGQGLSGSGTGLHSAALPVTGPRVVSLLIAGVAMIAAGAAAVYLTSRRRKRS